MFPVGALIQIGLVVGIFAAIAGGIAWFEHRAEERGATKEVIASCASDKTALKGAVNEQNEGLAKARDEAEKRAKVAEAALKAAQGTAAGYRKAAEELLAAQPKGEVCAAARDLMGQYARERQVKP